MRERVYLHVANGGERGHDHVEAIEPRPAFDHPEANGTCDREPGKQEEHDLQVVQRTQQRGLGWHSFLHSESAVADEETLQSKGSLGKHRRYYRAPSLRSGCKKQKARS